MSDDKQSEHPGRWPVNPREWSPSQNEEWTWIHDSRLADIRDYILQLERERDEAIAGYQKLSADLDRVEAENKSLRGNITKLNNKLRHRE